MAIKRTSITAVVHTYDEEKNVEDCLKSAQLLSSDIVLVDMGSTDKTVARAKKYTSQIYTFPHSFYVEPAREFGLQKAAGAWVFILDADERITPELAEEIRLKVEGRNGKEDDEMGSEMNPTSHIKHPASQVPHLTYYRVPRK